MIHLALALGCALATAALIVLLRPVLQRYALARPNARSSHKVPTPQGGGMAVVAASLAGLLLARIGLDVEVRGTTAEIVTIVAGATALGAAGAVDDIRGLSPLPRFGLQMVAIAALLAVLPGDARPLSFVPRSVELLVLLLGGVWFVNLTNFMDGIDWMTVAQVVPMAAGLAVLGALDAMPPRGALAAVALSAALVGFAPFNRPVARLFLGDVGSVPIGFLLVWLLILLAGRGHLAAALLLPMYYLADSTITLFRRLSRRERFWEAHRTHFYQRATDRGLSVLAIVTRVFVANLGLAALATWTVLDPSPVVSAAALAAGTLLTAGLLASLVRVRR